MCYLSSYVITTDRKETDVAEHIWNMHEYDSKTGRYALMTRFWKDYYEVVTRRCSDKDYLNPEKSNIHDLMLSVVLNFFQESPGISYFPIKNPEHNLKQAIESFLDGLQFVEPFTETMVELEGYNDILQGFPCVTVYIRLIRTVLTTIFTEEEQNTGKEFRIHFSSKGDVVTDILGTKVDSNSWLNMFDEEYLEGE